MTPYDYIVLTLIGIAAAAIITGFILWFMLQAAWDELDRAYKTIGEGT